MDCTLQNNKRKFVKVWCDGCYDMVHFGHANQLRQAKQMGSFLIVGVHTDEEIKLHKGPPVFIEDERYRMVRGIKWVDEVVEGAPYVTSVATLDEYGCGFCVHGDDITVTADGNDSYEEVKRCNRYRECQRTAGISTTDLVGRMLLLTRCHHSANDEQIDRNRDRALSLSTTIVQFSEGRSPSPNDVVVYACGAFDLFHVGHLSFLEEARKLGDYLVVGIHTDQVVNSYTGGNSPIMTLHERVLSVLAYKPVDEVIIGAPLEVTEDLIKRFNVKIVVSGLCRNAKQVSYDAFKVAKDLNIFKEIDSGNDMTTPKIINRIIQHRLDYEMRNSEKEKKEADIYNSIMSK